MINKNKGFANIFILIYNLSFRKKIIIININISFYICDVHCITEPMKHGIYLEN